MSCCLNWCSRSEKKDTSPTTNYGAVNSPQAPRPGSLYQDEPCISKSTIYDIGAVILGGGVLIGGVLSPPPFNAPLIAGGATLFAGNTTRAVIGCCREDENLRRQVDRLHELTDKMSGTADTIDLVTEKNQTLAERFAALETKMRGTIEKLVQQETEADRKALKAITEQFEKTMLLHEKMSGIINGACGILDKIQTAVEKKVENATAAARTSASLAQTAGELTSFTGDQAARLEQMQASVARYVQVQERFPAFLEAFEKSLRNIQQVKAEINSSTTVLESQVQALKQSKESADEQARQANSRADKARDAAAGLAVQLAELQKTQDAEIERLAKRVEGLVRIIDVVKEKAGEETLQQWIAATK